jgi:cobalt/nickel transport protein
MKYGMEIAVAALIIVFAAVFLYQNAAIQAGLGDGEEAWAGPTAMPPTSSKPPGTSPDRALLGAPERRDRVALLCPAGRHRRDSHRLHLRYWQGSRKTA